jgi:hypothetical protein
LVNSRLQANIEVTNFSAKDERVKITLKSAGGSLSSREIVVPAGRSTQANFESFPSHAYYEAEIGAKDALPLDNRRFAVPPVTQNLRILGISPRPQSLTSLRSIPGLNLDTAAPADYRNTEHSSYGLEIFHFSTPGALPRNPTLFILPPDNSLVELGKPVSRSIVSTWREPHALTRYVNFILFRPSYARVLVPRTPGEVIIESPDGPLGFATEINGIRYLVLGFDPFPYLGRENLPVSIFTLNFLDWFFEGARGKSKSTGEALTLGTSRPGNSIVTPDGQRLKLPPESTAFPATLHQGIYEVNRGPEKEYFAVNLQVSNESDLREPAAIELAGTSGGKNSASVFYSFWPYLLLATLLLLFAEWFLSVWTATTRSPFRARTSPSRNL